VLLARAVGGGGEADPAGAVAVEIHVTLDLNRGDMDDRNARVDLIHIEN
jgi:hypothetical protein